MIINRQDKNGVKPLLQTGEFGYDNYPAGGDSGRVYVGTGSVNIPLAKKEEMSAVDGKADVHIARVDNPHGVTKAQVGLGNADNTSDNVKNVLSAIKWATARTITLSGDVSGSASVDGSANVTITTAVQPNSVALGTDTTGDYMADIIAGSGISVSHTPSEGSTATITNSAPNVTTNITTTHNSSNVIVNSSDGTDGTINSATQTLAGVMSATDKTKLDGIEVGATADQTGAEIKALYESNANTNALTDTLLALLTTKKVKNVSTDALNDKLVITYTDGTVSNLNINDVITDIHVSGASLDATSNVLTLTSADGGADVIVDLSDFVNSSELTTALNTTVKLTTNQTITGTKTFNGLSKTSIGDNALEVITSSSNSAAGSFMVSQGVKYGLALNGNGTGLETGFFTFKVIDRDSKTVQNSPFNIGINGVVSYNFFPVTPSLAPTTNYQVANKKYVDDTAVKLTGDQTVAGVKTFTSSPIVPVPTVDFQSVPLRSTNIIVNVGAGQTYTTINQALEYLSGFYPMYKKSGVTATINLKAGFVMAEQVLVSGIDLGWITIVGENAETIITHTALTTPFSVLGHYPAFGVDRGGTSPVIGQLFRFNVEKVGGDKHGLVTFGAGSSATVSSGKGFIGAGTNGIFAASSSIINASGANCSNAGTNGIYASTGSTINASGANCSNAGSAGISAFQGAIINASGANCSNAGGIGISAGNNSTVDAVLSSVKDQTTGTSRVRVREGSCVSTQGIVTTGGTVAVFSQTVNTLTTHGIIYG